MKRTFRIGERVFNCQYLSAEHGFATVVSINGKTERACVRNQDMVILCSEETGKIFETTGEHVYKIAPRISKKLGITVCWEHSVTEYEFYIPSTDENYYRFELLGDTNFAVTT